MDSGLQNLAKELILSVKLLEREPEKLSSSQRELCMTRINRVLQMKLPLSEALYQGAYWAIINCFTLPKFEEKERISLLTLLSTLLTALPENNTFIATRKDQEKFTMLLISKLLETLKVTQYHHSKLRAYANETIVVSCERGRALNN